jgi:hypothetical protein
MDRSASPPVSVTPVPAMPSGWRAHRLLLDLLSPFPAMPSAEPRWTWWCAAAVTGLRLWLVAGKSLTAIGFAGTDDRWYLEMARSILARHWLGDYSQVTFIQGIGYPVWIAAVFVLGVPLLLAQHLLYAAGCLALWRAFRPLLRAPAAGLALCLLLL